MGFIVRWIITALAVGAACWIVPGINAGTTTDAWAAIALFGLALALVNVSLKPILQILSIPLTVLTLGIFYLVVNTLMLYVAQWLANGIFQIDFHIASFGSAFVAAIVVSVVSTILSAIAGQD